MKSLLLLHGALGSATGFDGLHDKLEGSFDLHALNFPGHGGTELPEAFSIESFASSVEAYCIEKGLVSVSIFGYSMGGYVGLCLAMKNPALVERVATLATKFAWTPETAARECNQLNPEVMEQKVPAFADELRQAHAPADWKEVVKKTAALLRELGNDPALHADAYAQIKIPVMLLLGDRDRMVSMEETIAVYKQLPSAQLGILPDTPHPLPQADPGLLATLIKRFMNDVS